MFTLCFSGLDTHAEFCRVPAYVAVDNAIPDSLAAIPVVPLGTLVLQQGLPTNVRNCPRLMGFKQVLMAV